MSFLCARKLYFHEIILIIFTKSRYFVFRFLKSSETLGIDLRTLRKSRGITLVELSKRLGRSVGWLSQVERDISSPNINELCNLAKEFNVPLSIFFGKSKVKKKKLGE